MGLKSCQRQLWMNLIEAVLDRDMITSKGQTGRFQQNKVSSKSLKEYDQNTVRKTSKDNQKSSHNRLNTSSLIYNCKTIQWDCL